MAVVSTHHPALLSAAETKAKAASTTSKTSVKAAVTHVRNGDAMLLLSFVAVATELMVCGVK